MKPTLCILAACLALAAPLAARAGDAAAGKAKSAACAACHGEDGVSKLAAFPKLAGQHEDYLHQALKAYKSGKRKNPTMAAQVQALSDADLADLAAYFSSQKGLTVKY